jgi:hypothetical protein
MGRSQTFVLSVLIIILVSSCDYWPEDLEPLANSISQEVSGEATAWRVGGDVVVIDVANSPLYRGKSADLEAVATGIAEQAVAFVAAPLESVSVTFHEGVTSENSEKMRGFIFLIRDNQPVLQPLLDFDATGPLTPAEIEALFIDTDEPMSPEREKCVLEELEDRARAAGDPESLDPATVEFLPIETWHQLDPFGRRLVLAQVISTKAFMVCSESGERRSLQDATSGND